MQRLIAFLNIARKEGFNVQAAQAAFHTMESRLREAGYHDATTFYIYRTAPRMHGEGAGGAQKEPSRLLLAFSSPDAALAFAQHHRLKPIPRLLPVTLEHLLIVLVQQAAIQAVIFTEESAPVSPDTHIPTVLRLGRLELLDMLKGKGP